MADSEFMRILQNLGLEQYHDSFVAEAFDSWLVLSQITEQDMTDLGMRLGHRRVRERQQTENETVLLAFTDSAVVGQILQNAIAQYKNTAGPLSGQQAPAASRENAAKQEGSPASASSTSEKSTQRQKRKYVRHPKVDENAPARPPTGYVMFSNWVREHIKDQNYDFPDIAKLVGRRWQALPKHEKDWFLTRAKEHKAVYMQEMALYKRTAKHREYQKYLLDFKIRNGTLPPARGHGRARSELSLDDDDEHDASNGEHFDDTVAGASKYGAHDLPPVRTTNDRHTLPQLRSPSQISPTTTSIPPVAALTSTTHTASGPASKYHLSGANSPSSSYNRLPPTNNPGNRQLPPLPMPQFRPEGF